jgi:ketosteroid isomerase-like protein
MSGENIDVARSMREALIRGGPDAAVEFFHPDVTFDVAVGRFEGIEGMSLWFETIIKYLIDYEVVDAEFIAAGDCVVVNNIMRARGGHTPLATQDQIYLLRFKDGLVIDVSRHATKDAAVTMAESG